MTPVLLGSHGRAGRHGPEPRWWTLIAVCGASFMLMVDITVVQVALPTIQHDLRASFTDLQWVIDAYALTLAAFILTLGSLADRFGRKRVFAAGLGVFTVASLLCGVADSTPFLIAARVLQGFGGAAMFATGLALIGQEFTGAERTKALAAWGATLGLAVAAGPLVGGGLTDALGWRSIFFVNVPIGLLTVGIAVARTVNITAPDAGRVDWGGLAAFSGSLFSFVLALLRGNADGWGSTLIVSLLLASVVLMAVFVLAERRCPTPMFDLSLLRKPAFSGVSVATFAVGAGMFAMLPYLTLYLQDSLGYSPLVGGLCLLPTTIVCFLVPLVVRPAVHRLPPRIVLSAGLAITALGLAVMRGLTVTSSWTALVPGLLLIGVGVGLVNPAIAAIALSVAPPERAGMASGISNTFRIAGLAAGVAILGAVFEHRLATSLASQLGRPAGQLAEALASGATRASTGLAAQHGLTAVSHQAFVSGITEILSVGAVLTACGAVAALALVRARDLRRPPVAAPAEPEPASPAGTTSL